MKRILLISFALLLALPAYAADDTVIVTPGTGVTLKSKDCSGGKQCMQQIMSDTSANPVGTTTNPFYTSTVAADPCQSLAHTYAPISQTGATNTSIVTAVSAKKIYVCQLIIVTGLANNIGVVEGTGSSTCTGGTVAGVIGGTTAANGLNLSANSGLALGNGSFAVAQTANVNQNLCLITSASGPVAGGITYVTQ